MQSLTSQDFTKKVSNRNELTLVQFTTEWSGACQILAPVIEELAKAYHHQVQFFSVNAEEEVSLEKRYRIMEYPTILFFKGGEIIDHAVGLIPKNSLISKIENALANY